MSGVTGRDDDARSDGVGIGGVVNSDEVGE